MSELGAGGQPDAAMNEADGGPPMITEPEAAAEPPEEVSSASAGCGTEPTLESSASPNMVAYNTVTSGGTERRYILRLPENYDSAEPHRLILGFHGAGDSPTNVAGNPAFFGLYELTEGSTIFIAPEAVGGLWSDANDVVFVDDILEQVEADLCIDTSRIIVQGFSQGGAMTRLLACERPGRFRAAIANSAGGLPMPASCDPIPFLGSLGLQESGGGGQAGQTDFFATANGCTVEAHPAAPGGGHLCSEYQACMDGFPVVWCSYDAGHTPLPNDAGQNSSWMPERVWEFVSQF